MILSNSNFLNKILIYLLTEKNENMCHRVVLLVLVVNFAFNFMLYILQNFHKTIHFYFRIKMILFSKINRRALKAVHSEKVSEE